MEKNYVVEMKNNSGTGLKTTVRARSEHQAMQLAESRNNGYRAVSVS